MRFTWDPEKAASNLKKHGVSFPEAVTVFADPLALVMADVLHEDRGVLVGLSRDRRVLFTVFVETSEEVIRIISAHERKRYEEGNS